MHHDTRLFFQFLFRFLNIKFIRLAQVTYTGVYMNEEMIRIEIWYGLLLYTTENDKFKTCIMLIPFRIFPNCGRQQIRSLLGQIRDTLRQICPSSLHSEVSSRSTVDLLQIVSFLFELNQKSKIPYLFDTFSNENVPAFSQIHSHNVDQGDIAVFLNSFGRNYM